MSTKNKIKSKTHLRGKNTAFSFWLVWAAIFVLYAAIRINIVNIPLDRDEGMFCYAGQVILDHGLPYKDAIENKPPVTFYICALALLFVPPTATGIHIFLHTYNFLTLIALFYLAKTYSESYSTGLWAAFTYAIFSSSPSIQGFTASTEMFMLLPVTLCLLLALLAVRKGRLYFSMLSGVCGGLACWTKPTGALMILFVILYLFSAQVLVTRRQQSRFINVLNPLLMWGAGFAFVTLLIAGYFYYYDSFDELIYWSIIHNYHYSKAVNILDNLPRFYKAAGEIAEGNIVIIAVGLFAGLMNILKKNARGCFALGFLFFSLLATVPGYSYKHYFAQIAPALTIAGGFGFSFLCDSIRNRGARIAATLSCALLIVAVPLSVYSGYYFSKSPVESSRDFLGPNPFPELVDLADFISKRTGRDDSIFILGSEPEILLYSRRRSATAFTMLYPLTSTIFPRHKEFQKEAWKEVRDIQPKYIIFVNLPTSLMWDGRAELWILGKLEQIVKKSYFLEAVMTIEEPKGKLLLVSEMENFREQFERYRIPIFVYKRRRSALSEQDKAPENIGHFAEILRIDLVYAKKTLQPGSWPGKAGQGR